MEVPSRSPSTTIPKGQVSIRAVFEEVTRIQSALPFTELANGRYASNDNSAELANKWKAKHETGNANSEIVVSVHETVKSNHEMSAEGMGRTFCPTPKMAKATAGHPGMANMRGEAAVRVI